MAGLPQTPRDLSGASWGGSVQVGLAPRVGIEAFAATSTSSVPESDTPNGIRGGTESRVSVATLLVQYDVSPNPERLHLWLGVGPAYVQHGGATYAQFGSPAAWGPALGLELAAPMTEHLQFVADGSGVSYDYDLERGLPHGTQFDAMLSFGLRWHTGR